MLDDDSLDNSLVLSSCGEPRPICVADLGDWKRDLRYMDQKRRFRILGTIPEDDPQYEELEEYLFNEIGDNDTLDASLLDMEDTYLFKLIPPKLTRNLLPSLSNLPTSSSTPSSPM